MTLRDVLLAIEETGQLPRLNPLVRYYLKLGGWFWMCGKNRAQLTAKGVVALLESA